MAKIPHLQHFVTDDLQSVCENSDVLVITNKEKEFASVLTDYPNKTIKDLVRQWKEVDNAGHYEGISWGDINANKEAQHLANNQDFRQVEF